MFASSIKKVAVIGAGVMGSQIAAHIANAGVPVILIDIVPEGAPNRNILADAALERMKKETSIFMRSDNARLVTTGNLEDDLGKLSDVDWIIEAVLEDRQIKSGVYKKIDAVRKAGSAVSSNTSTIPFSRLLDGQSESFKKNFLVTHFFNPPRQMRLLEFVAGEKTSPEVVKTVTDFCDQALGKNIISCIGTPCFVVNRLGFFFLQCAMNAAFDLGLTVEEADAVFSKPLGMPNTGIFGLVDLIGLDLMLAMDKNFLSSLSEDDPYRAVSISHPLTEQMIADGYTGRKGKGGFYRTRKTEAGVSTEAIDFKTGKYRPIKKIQMDSGEDMGKFIRTLCDGQDNIGKFTWIVLSETLVYAASLVPQIVDDIVSADTGASAGFNWKYGLFELMDIIGAKWFADKLRAAHRAVPELLRKAENASFYKVVNGKLEFLTTEGKYRSVVRPEGVLLLADVKRAFAPVIENVAASVWDIGDGVLCFEFHSKMNTIDLDTLALLDETIMLIEKNGARYKGLVIYNEADLFSAGVNLGKGVLIKDVSALSTMRQILRKGHRTYHHLRFARFPSVSAPAGLAIGGGCELMMHCSAAQAHAETSVGLVEVLIGVIPGWGGCTQTLGRAFEKYGSADPLVPVRKAFEIISQGRRSTSAFEARDLLYLRETDGITMNRNRLLYDAKERVLQLAKDYKPPKPYRLNLPGPAGYAFLESMIEGWRALGSAYPHDITVAKALASLLCGIKRNPAQPVTEAQLLGLECREFMKLEEKPETAARIEHMLKTGKPLKN